MIAEMSAEVAHKNRVVETLLMLQFASEEEELIISSKRAESLYVGRASSQDDMSLLYHGPRVTATYLSNLQGWPGSGKKI